MRRARATLGAAPVVLGALLVTMMAGLAGGACSTIGSEGFERPVAPHGGTGPFRLLETEETGLRGRPDGRALMEGPSVGVESGMAVDGHLFYAAAPLIDSETMDPEGQPAWEVDWSQFELRRILRAPRISDEERGFEAGEPVLERSWDGGEVFDPWVVVDADGRALMYYAADGGIGLAVADGVDGSFATVGEEPLVGPNDDGVPRRPSVIRDGEQWWMYFERAGRIEVARSDDGETFAPMGPVTFEPSTAGDPSTQPDEVSKHAPGALRVETVSDRRIIRLYFQSVREDGTAVVGLAGSLDGTTFERAIEPVYEGEAPHFPSPVQVTNRITLLYLTEANVFADTQVRALVGAIAPPEASLAPTQPEE